MSPHPLGTGRRPVHSRAAVGVVAAALLVLTGCGSDENTPSELPGATTPPEVSQSVEAPDPSTGVETPSPGEDATESG